jgi:hypothetical protein
MEIKCQTCEEAFEKSDIIVTSEGLFCSQCLPDNVDKKFFTIHVSWQGLNALIAAIDGNPTVDQLFIIDKIKDKLVLVLMEAIKEHVKNSIQESDS